jgi:epoxyqueuosine reductase
MLPNTEKLSRFVKEKAALAGFEYCGIAKAVPLTEDARRLEKWLHKGFHGSMKYMENHFDLRIDPAKLVPGAKSVITVLKNYYPQHRQQAGSPKIAKYAFGKDYHDVIRSQLNFFLQELMQETGQINGRGFVDSAPVLERSWATRSGLGWIGKNGNFITKQKGSFFFIATLITDLELAYDDLFAKDYCGSCRKCIDACPTSAILPDKVIDGSKCISYFTIELKDLLIPDNLKGKFDNWIFGCDICQDVCPWNRFSTATNEQEFMPIPEILNLTTQEWESMSEEAFRKLFRHSPLNRAKWKGLQRNIRFIQQS